MAPILPLLTILCLLVTIAQAQTITPANCQLALPGQVALPATLDTPIATLSSDLFTVNWIWTITQTRAQLPSYQFGTCSSVATTISAATGDCTLAQSARTSWSDLTTNCGWTNSSSSGVLTYTGSLFLTGTETFMDVRNTLQTRALHNEFALAVAFPEDTIVTSGITAVAPVLVDFFILAQTFDRPTNTGIVHFQTRVQLPWSIELLTPVGSSNLNTATAVTDTSNPATTEGNLFVQNWILTIDPDSSACTLDGTYTVPSQLNCTLSNQSDCPALAASDEFPLAMTVASEDFCALTSINVPVVGTLGIFSDATYLVDQTNFVLGARSFYQLHVTSSSATITTIAIDQVIVSASTAVLDPAGTLTDSLVLYQAVTLWNPLLATPNLGLATANAGTQKFDFALNSGVVAIDQDSSVDLTISVRATISFLGSTKRTTLATFQLSSQKKSFNTTLSYASIDTTTSVATRLPGSLVLFSMFVLAASIF